MLNRKKVKKFTDSVYDLMINQKVSFGKVIEILEENSCRYLRETAVKIKSELEGGNLLSNALFKCEQIHFDPTYIVFVCFAEKTGSLEEAVSFLKKRCDRKEENIQKIISVAAYPMFVLIMAISICILLFIYGESLIANLSMEKSLLKVKLIKIIFSLFAFCFFVFCVLKKNLGENKLYESFMAVNFLIKSGIDIGSAVGYGIIVNGPGTRYGKFFEIARQRLEYGMDLRGAFCNFDRKGFLSKWQIELDEALFFAQKAGEKSDAFEKICNWLEKENEKKRQLCLSIIEPLFTSVTGIILLVLMINFMMPVMNSVSLIN